MVARSPIAAGIGAWLAIRRGWRARRLGPHGSGRYRQAWDLRLAALGATLVALETVIFIVVTRGAPRPPRPRDGRCIGFAAGDATLRFADRKSGVVLAQLYGIKQCQKFGWRGYARSTGLDAAAEFDRTIAGTDQAADLQLLRFDQTAYQPVATLAHGDVIPLIGEIGRAHV